MKNSLGIIIRSNFAVCLLISCCFSLQQISAQFNEDFSSGSLATNNWAGDLDLFTINAAQELQLNDLDPESSNSSRLVNSVATGDSTQWSFNFSYDFSPSASNFAVFILAADNPDFENYFGYFIKMGGISGSDDAIELWRKDGNNEVLLISGNMGTIGTTTVNAAVRCTRDFDSNWTLELDALGGTSYSLEGTFNDDTYVIGNEIGLICQYSSTRADKFFFDNITIGPTYVDDDPAQLLDFFVESENQLRIVFNESLASTSIAASNFSLNPNIDFSSILFSNIDNNQIAFNLANTLSDGQQYELSVKNITDLSGNIMADTILKFDYLKIDKPDPNDIVINEIMADPSPSVGLPEVEYVELYNASEKNFQLSDMTFADRSIEVVLSDYILKKGDYVLLYKSEANDPFPSVTNKMGTLNFPGLGNENDELTLYDADGLIINSVEYNIAWYNNSDRDDGGYSLERIDPNRPCLAEVNWQASVSNFGGTPGLENANVSLEVEQVPFNIEHIFPISNSVLSIRFSSSLSSNVIDQLSLFDVNGFTATNIISTSNQFDAFEVSYDQEFEVNQLYEFCLQSGFKDCQENIVLSEVCQNFGIPIQPQLGDIFINEILPNPATGGSDFVEIVNTTDNIYDLSALFLASVDSNGLPFQVNSITDQFLLLPNDFVVLTENPADILSRYQVPKPENLIEMNLPTLDDKEGTVLLILSDFPNEVILDRLDYSEDWHNPLLDIKDGVSLERISVIDITNNSANWRSASQTVGFATPTGKNSQSLQPAQIGDSPFSFEEKRLSPDDDGFEDFLGITYSESQDDFLVNIRVYDIQGRLVKEIANNYSPGKQAFFRWDGDRADGNKARMGIYILWLERFSPDGKVERFKEQIVLAEKLD